METLLTTKTASITELREAGKVLDRAGATPVAIFRRDTVVAYLVPVDAINATIHTKVADDDVKAMLTKRRKNIEPTLAYLKDK
jgi:hypothetical protein